MQSTESKKYSLYFWKRAFRFHLHHRNDLFPVLPLLLIPLWTDCYHSALIRQEIKNGGKIHPLKAAVETLELFPSFAMAKFRFFFLAVLWSFVPIVGWSKDLRYRIEWAMTSNIIVFEKLAGEAIHHRCNELIDLGIVRKLTSSLLIIPGLLTAMIFVLFTFAMSIFPSSLFFWISVFIIAWIVLPASAAVNTFVYLAIVNGNIRQPKNLIEG